MWDDLVTDEVSVAGRRASFAVGGRGLPVLFLHGWGLDHRAYEPSLRHLTARGCRVLAPSLPGFGGTPGLPLAERSLAGYAAWVDEFLAAADASEPVLVLGHSFGGGVATRLAHDHPDRVRYLVLLNSVGDPRWLFANAMRRLTAVLRRNPVNGVVETLRPSADGIATTTLIQRVTIENLVRNPLAVLQAGWVAGTADLNAEMADLAQRELPVMLLWSDRDGVIPSTAFDMFCSTFGTDGHVVSGGHSWLLANPQVFGEVLDNVIHVQSAEHHSGRATASISQLRRLLEPTTVPRRVSERLLDGVSPLWVLGESAVVLAADLTLCHPRLEPGEVRAVAREMPAPNTYRLTVVASDRPGLLADTTAALAADSLSVESASATTWPDRSLALHAVTVRSETGLDDRRWAAIGTRLRGMAAADRPALGFVPAGQARVTRTGAGDGRWLVRVTAPDQVGLLSAVCRWFADRGVSVEAASVTTVDEVAEDIFLVGDPCDVDALARHLSARRARRRALCLVPFGIVPRCLRRRPADRRAGDRDLPDPVAVG